MNEAGEEPLRSSDPLERIFAAHLAAAAPYMQDLLKRMVPRMEHLIGATGTPNMDEKLVQEGWGTIVCSKPPYEAVAKLWRAASQREFDFEQSA